VTLDATHACVIDLDGVVWLAGAALPGASEAVELLRRHGVAVLFATNNAAPTVAELRARLARVGIDAAPEEVATSAQAAASLLAPGDRVHVLGAAGLCEAVDAVGAERDASATPRDVASVLVGLTTSFDYHALDVASTLVRDGSRFIATNRDPTLPVPGGQAPGAGAIVAAVASASGREPEVAGKPHEPMCELVRRRVQVGVVVGDRASTDGRFAAALGVPFAHVASGIGEPADGAAVSAPDLLRAVEALLG